MASNETASTQGGLRPARRTIVKGAAWAVPAVAVAAPAAHAATSPCTNIVTAEGSCKNPGGGGTGLYRISWCVTNTCRLEDGSLPTVVRITSVRSQNGFPLNPGAPCAYPIEVSLDANGMGCSTLCTYSAQGSAGTVYVTYDFGMGTPSIETPGIPAPPEHDDCVPRATTIAPASGDAERVESETGEVTSDQSGASTTDDQSTDVIVDTAEQTAEPDNG